MLALRAVLLAGFVIACTSGCGRSSVLEAEISETEIAGTLTAYVTSWLDLDDHFNRGVAKSGAGIGLTSRIEGGHHEIQCLQVLQYAYVSVAFDANPGVWYRYRVDCKHDQGTAGI